MIPYSRMNDRSVVSTLTIGILFWMSNCHVRLVSSFVCCPSTSTSTRPRSIGHGYTGAARVTVQVGGRENDKDYDDREGLFGKNVPQRHQKIQDSVHKSALGVATALVVLLGSSILLPTGAYADEYGREVEAPTIGTGETIMICTKRGPLGACTKTEFRTDANENDKSKKYFREPTELVKRKDNIARTAETTEGNTLIERLKQQSQDNREKNDLLVKQRTMLNDSVSFLFCVCTSRILSFLGFYVCFRSLDCSKVVVAPHVYFDRSLTITSLRLFLGEIYKKLTHTTTLYSFTSVHQNTQSASFGPFDSQVLILNEDGKGFTVLPNPQAMRLKNAGLISDDKKFIRQPTQEELDAALEAGPNLLDRLLQAAGGGGS